MKKLTGDWSMFQEDESEQIDDEQWLRKSLQNFQNWGKTKLGDWKGSLCSKSQKIHVWYRTGKIFLNSKNNEENVTDF